MSSASSSFAPVKAMKAPVSVVVSGAAGQIGYAVVFAIASGRMLGDDQPIDLRLLDIPMCKHIVDGIVMELEDCAFSTLAAVTEFSDPELAFKDVDIALLIGGRPRGPGMTRADLLQANAAIFRVQGAALNKFAKRTVKVLVVANPANTNALILAQNAPDLPKTAFSAMTRLDQNRATALLAKHTKTGLTSWKNVIVWGNHSSTQYPSVHHASFINPIDGSVIPASERVKDAAYLTGEFIKTVQYRGTAIIDQMKKSSAASAANAAMDHVRDWVKGTAPNEYVSMAVYSDGKHYGVPEGLIFSFPCQCHNGEFKIVDGLQLDDFDNQKLKATADELADEARQATAPPTPATH